MRADSVKDAGIGKPIVKMRRLWGRFILIMGIPILVNWLLYIEPPEIHLKTSVEHKSHSVSFHNMFQSVIEYFEILHIARQCHCHALCKISLGKRMKFWARRFHEISEGFLPVFLLLSYPADDSSYKLNTYDILYICTCKFSRGCHEIWEALLLRTSNMASALVRNQMCTCPKLIILICAIICSSIGRVSRGSHLFDKAKIAFRTIGSPIPWPLFRLPWHLRLSSWCTISTYKAMAVDFRLLTFYVLFFLNVTVKSSTRIVLHRG